MSSTMADNKFSLSFVKRLIDESEGLDIQISGEYFNKEKTLKDLVVFREWKEKTEQTLKMLEMELNARSRRKAATESIDEAEQDVEKAIIS